MISKVQRWGNSQGLRLSKEMLEQANIAVGEEITISAKAGKIIIEKPKKFDLADMVAKMPKNYKAEEFPKSRPVGKEVW